MGLCFTANDWHWSDPVVECVARVDIDQAPDPAGGDDTCIKAMPTTAAPRTATARSSFAATWPPGARRPISWRALSCSGAAHSTPASASLSSGNRPGHARH
ncbi:hypothetical protein pclt_cds_152 [Pandoravirus celtis]|uniref:Uncharacterized protein n=1 Tax=Pandoravirus celtis TaxID=2568002 RepID=A0A4D6EFV0_9VIRU|nr:hypothetical protein pclt_cds_152 [Pandoravirus celtis]